MHASSSIQIALLATLLGCGGTEPPVEPSAPASLTVVSGGDQHTEIGKELSAPVVVRITDAQGVPVAGQLVNFVVTKGEGSVFAGAAQTNAAGEARERWTMGLVAGEQALEARAVDQATGDPIVFGQVTAIADPGPAKYFSLTNGTQRLFLGERLDVTTMVYDVLDEFGNGVPNSPVTLDAPAPFTTEGATIWSTVETKKIVNVTIGTGSQPVEVTVRRNLSELVGATGGWDCEGLRFSITGTMTRLQVDFVVDSATYPARIEGFSLEEAGLWITRRDTQTFNDGSTSVVGPTAELLVAVDQEPGLFVMRRWANTSFSSGPQDVAQVGTDPLSYRGASLCDGSWNLVSFTPFTLTR